MKKENQIKFYTMTIIIIGLMLIFEGLPMIISEKIWVSFMFFAVLSILGDSLIIEIDENSYISIGFAIALSSILIFEPEIAGLIMFIGSTFKVYKEEGKLKHLFNSSAYKRLFNGCSYGLSAVIAAYSYQLGMTLMPESMFYKYSILGILISVIVYMLTNLMIYTALYTIISGENFLRQLLKNTSIAKNFIFLAPIGVLMAFSYEAHGWFIVILFLGPLLLARYTFKLYTDMKKVYFDTIKSLSNALDAKDEYTNGHSQRVANYSEAIAKIIGLSEFRIEQIKTAATLHDIGKIGISDMIINKSDKLDFKEMYEVRRHPEIGENILKEISNFRDVAKFVRHHHERYDGNGYPDSLSGDAISLEASIISVADSYDAITSDRAYRKALSAEIALNIIADGRGSQFNPIVVDAFLKYMNYEKGNDSEYVS